MTSLATSLRSSPQPQAGGANGAVTVQTLARMNRIYPGKERTFILDFRNTVEDIQEAFKPYYTFTTMEDVSDSNQVYSLQARLLAFGVLDGRRDIGHDWV